MRRYPEHLVRQARRLAANEQLNYKEIAQKLRVNPALISTWCNISENQKYRNLLIKNQNERKLYIESEKSIFCDFAVDNRKAKLFCALP